MAEKKVVIAVVAIIAIVAVLGVVVLYHDGVIGATSIKTITDNPSEWYNRNVMVKGTYRGYVPILDVYLVNDSSGPGLGIAFKFEGIISISKGDAIVVSGEVEAGIFGIPYIVATDIHEPWVLK
ncbi:MAG: hypothetical protein ACFFBD_26730 [Candidatus Hodarchaeota archaeon]